MMLSFSSVQVKQQLYRISPSFSLNLNLLSVDDARVYISEVKYAYLAHDRMI